MSIAKIIQVVANSDKSFDDAIQQGVTSAAQTVRGIHGVKIIDWTAKVANDKITGYKVTMDIAFAVEAK